MELKRYYPSMLKPYYPQLLIVPYGIETISASGVSIRICFF